MRSLFNAMAIALALFVSASNLSAANQLGNQQAGYSLVDAATHQPNGGTNGYDVNANSLVADPEDNEAAYYFDGDEIRRYDFADGSDIAVYDVPEIDSADAPGTLSNISDFTTMTGEVWGAFLRFDPSNSSRLIFGESSQRALHEYTLDSSRTNVASARTIYLTDAADDWSPFDAAFLSTGELVVSRGGSINGDPFNRLTIIDSSTNPSTITDLAELPGYSGPITVDSAGNLLYVVPQNTAPITDATHVLLLSWTPAQIAAAIADYANDALTAANGMTLRNPDLPAFSFITQIHARQENGVNALYVGTYGTGITRLDLDNQANDADVVDIINFASLSSFGFSSSSAEWAPNLGPNDNGSPTARLFVLTSQWVAYNDQPSCIARIGSDGGLTDVEPNMVTFLASKPVVEPYTGDINETFNLSVSLRDEMGELIQFGPAANQQYVIEVFENNGGVAGAQAAFASGGGAIAAQNGVVLFSNLGIANAGSYILRIRDLAATIQMETSIEVLEIGSIALVSVNPVQPKAGESFEVSIEIRDQNGQRITSGALASTILSIDSVSGSGTLIGSTVAQAVDGLVAFSNLSVTVQGLYRLTIKTDTGNAQNGTLIEVPISVLSAAGANGSNGGALPGGSGCALHSSGSNLLWLLALSALVAALGIRRRQA